MEKKKRLNAKETYKTFGHVTWKSSDKFIKAGPSYLDIPNRIDLIRMGWKEPEPTVRLDKVKKYPEIIRLILKNPCYFYSFLGHNIARDWSKSYGLTAFQATILQVVGYHEVFYAADIRFWCFNVTTARDTLKWLVKENFILSVKVPNSNTGVHKKGVYTLSTLGKNFIEGYEAFYDSKMAEIKHKLGTSDLMQRRSHTLMQMDRQEKKTKEEIWNARILKTSKWDATKPHTFSPILKSK